MKKKRRAANLTYGQQVIQAVNVIVGLWLCTMFVLIFLLLRDGYAVSEPNRAVATAELAVTAVLAAWFTGQLGHIIFKIVRGKK